MRVSILAIILILGFNISAQEIYFERITKDDGLSQNNVLAICRDSEGYMWFGSYDGLNRYDGYDFKIYKSSNDENSITGNLIADIIEDHNKSLWIAVFDNGVCRFDKTTEQFTRILNTPEKPDLIAGNTITAMTCDSQNRIWLCSSKGLSCIIQDGSRIEKIYNFRNDTANPASLYNNFVEKVFEDEEGKFWISTKYNLELMNLNPEGEIQNSFQHFLTEDNYYDLFDIEACPEGLIVLNHDGALLFKYDSLNPEASEVIELENHSSIRAAFDSKGNLWATGYNGIYYFENTPGQEYPYTISRHFVEGPGEENLSNLFVRNVFIDKTGIIWFGTNGGGVLKYNPQRTQFRHYKKTEEKGSIAHNKVWTFFEDDESNFWIGTEGGGISLLPAEDNHNYRNGFESFNIAPPGEQNFVFDIVDISTVNEKKLLLGSGYQTLVAELTDTKYGWVYKPVIRDIIYQVMNLWKDQNNTIWLGTYHGGLGKYSYETDKLIVYKPDNSDIPSTIIRNIFEDSKGRLWIGTDVGLMLLTPEQKQNDTLRFTLFTNDPKDSTTISHNYTVPILETSDGEIWVGTFGGGINIYHEGTTLSNGTFTFITINDGLPDNTIKSMVEDNNGDIWVSSNNGITRIIRDGNIIRNFTKQNRLQSLEFTDLAGYKRRDGELLFGGVNGFNAFYPYEVFVDTVPPLLVINKLELMNKPVGIGEEIDGNIILDRAVNQVDSIVLKHTQNNIKLYFAALQYTAPEGNRFKYFLQGFDSDWITAPIEARFANYTNLEIGRYTFLLQGANSDGVWSPEPKSLHIWIKPPFWLTLWFKLSVIIFGILLASSIIWYRFHLIKMRNLLLETEVRKRTQRLEEYNTLLNETNTQLEERQQVIEEQSEELRAQRDTLEELNVTKDKFYSILAHDLKGPFNTLVGYLELLRLRFSKYDDEERIDKLNTAYNSSTLLLKFVENLLQWSRAQRGLIHFSPEQANIHVEAQEVIKILINTAKAKEVTLNYEISDKGLVTNIDVNIFKTVLRNLISNAIKYTRENDSISISISADENYLVVRVTDTGIGIPKEVVPKLLRLDNKYTTEGTAEEKGTGLGLVLCKEFVEIHKGNIGIESTEGKGTTVSFVLKTNID